MKVTFQTIPVWKVTFFLNQGLFGVTFNMNPVYKKKKKILAGDKHGHECRLSRNGLLSFQAQMTRW